MGKFKKKKPKAHKVDIEIGLKEWKIKLKIHYEK